ncbi:hypothetical protein SCLCIDRAFT_85220, partial [Scleroderma citrinum Foug A]
NNTPTPDPLLLFMQAVQALTRVASASADHDSLSGKTKVCKPNTFNGTDPCKLCTFLILCELNFQNRPKAFAMDCAKVTYVQSYLRGMALKWFKLDLLNVSNPNTHPIWMDNYHQTTPNQAQSGGCIDSNCAPKELRLNASTLSNPNSLMPFHASNICKIKSTAAFVCTCKLPGAMNFTLYIHAKDAKLHSALTSPSVNTPNLSGVPQEYHTFADIFCKAKATMLTPH